MNVPLQKRWRPRIGALVHDLPRFIRSVVVTRRWESMHNRDDVLSVRGRGVRVDAEFSTELHVARVFPSAARQLMQVALREWPVERALSPAESQDPVVSFVIGHRGLERLPLLLCTLQTIAAQVGVPIECIVVEQSSAAQSAGHLPPWVRYVHAVTALDAPYNRSWGFNIGARLARGSILVLHDNDILVPCHYAREIVARLRDADAADLKRFLFYLSTAGTDDVIAGRTLQNLVPESVIQNARGGSIAVRSASFLAVGGFDEAFEGWGGEDNDFFERLHVAMVVDDYGYLPMVHLFHSPQPGKLRAAEAPAVRRYYARRTISPRERIRELLARGGGSLDGPSTN